MGFAPPGIHLDCEYHQTGLVTYVGYPEHLIKVAGPNLRREWRILRGIDDEAAKNIMRAIVATKDNPDRLLSDYLALALGRKMAGWFIDPIGKNFTSEKRANIGKVLEYITDNLREQMTLQELASVANMSQSHFVRQFHEITGRTPHGYVREKRVDLAKRLLRESSMTTAEIALICGFSSQSHMTVVFKKWAGVTPGQFRSM